MNQAVQQDGIVREVHQGQGKLETETRRDSMQAVFETAEQSDVEEIETYEPRNRTDAPEVVELSNVAPSQRTKTPTPSTERSSEQTSQDTENAHAPTSSENGNVWRRLSNSGKRHNREEGEGRIQVSREEMRWKILNEPPPAEWTKEGKLRNLELPGEQNELMKRQNGSGSTRSPLKRG